MTPSRIFLLLLLHPAALSAQSLPEFGARLNYHTVFVRASDASRTLSGSYRPGYQAGIFMKVKPEKWISLRTEANYSLMGYFSEGEKIDYHYIGAAAILDIRLAKNCSLGAGEFVNLLMQSTEGDGKYMTDAGVLASVCLRNNKFEIQARYQWSLTAFADRGLNPSFHFHAYSIGLAYYFHTNL